MLDLLALIVVFAVFLMIVFIARGGEDEKPARDPDVERRAKPRGPFTDEDLVTIASFLNPGLAHIAKTKLASEGIDSYLANEVLGSMHYPSTLVDGGVHLRVRESEAEVARKILDF